MHSCTKHDIACVLTVLSSTPLWCAVKHSTAQQNKSTMQQRSQHSTVCSCCAAGAGTPKAPSSTSTAHTFLLPVSVSSVQLQTSGWSCLLIIFMAIQAAQVRKSRFVAQGGGKQQAYHPDIDQYCTVYAGTAIQQVQQAPICVTLPPCNC